MLCVQAPTHVFICFMAELLLLKNIIAQTLTKWCKNCIMNIVVSYGAWLSLVERCVRDAEVAGSNPVISTIIASDLALWCGVVF